MDLAKGWRLAIQEGVAQGLRVMPGWPMAVKGNDIKKVEQSALVLYGPVAFESYVQGLAVAWNRDGKRFPLIPRVRLRSNNMFS